MRFGSIIRGKDIFDQCLEQLPNQYLMEFGHQRFIEMISKKKSWSADHTSSHRVDDRSSLRTGEASNRLVGPSPDRLLLLSCDYIDNMKILNLQ